MTDPKWKLTHLHSGSGRLPVMWWGEAEIEIYQATRNDLQAAAGQAHQWQVNYGVGKARATAVFDTYGEAKDFADEWADLLVETHDG